MAAKATMTGDLHSHLNVEGELRTYIAGDSLCHSK